MRDGWKHPSLFLFSLCLLLSACSNWGRVERVDRLAAEHGWTPARYQAGRFTLFAFERFHQDSAELRIYIEGDGRPWWDRYTPARDPTPTGANALELAVEDQSSAIYLARPCQFLAKAELAHCDPAYWLEARYAAEIVAGLNEAVTRAKQKARATKITLIGYSGGGTLAVLVGAARNDIARIITVGANLDHAAWTSLDNSSPLVGSLNAADYARQIQAIPQVHFVGERDKLVPISVTNAYLARASDRSQIRVVAVDATHECCWAERWPELLSRYVPPLSN